MSLFMGCQTKRESERMKWFVVYVSKLGRVKFDSYRRFCSFVDLLGDGVSRVWVAIE
jgi:hypothetical protein